MKPTIHTLTKDGRALILRPAIGGDAKAIIDYVNAIDTESTFLAREPGEFEVGVREEQALLTKWYDDPRSLYLVAQVDGQIVGACACIALSGRKRYLHRASVSLGVRKPFWGLGIGRSLMQSVLNWADGSSLEQVELEVDETNINARRLYESVGFKEQGRILRERKMTDGTYRDAICMVYLAKKGD